MALRYCRACIGFTATIPDHKQESCFEARWLNHLKFEIRSNFRYLEEPKGIDCEISDFVVFFDNSFSASKLIWCDDDLKLIRSVSKETESREFKAEIDNYDITVIRSMEGRCLIVTNKELMRGIDYLLKKTEGSMK